MTARIATLAALLVGGTVAAQQPPRYFLAPDFPLTVRDWPGGPAAGSLPAGAGPIEIGLIDETGAWGRIALGETDGWVSIDALRPFDIEATSYAPIPAGLVCTGTEPFWSLRFDADNAVSAAPGVDEATVGVDGHSVAEGRKWPIAIRMDDVTAVLRPAACHDGMSDRTQSWSVDVLNADGLRTGCCRLPLQE